MKDAVHPLPPTEEPMPVPATNARNGPFDELLSASEFPKLRGRLVRIFARRGCSFPEDLADETIARVLSKLPEIGPSYEGDPLRYIHAVARNVFREYVRRPRMVSIEERVVLAAPPKDDPWPGEAAQRCLESCLSRLNAADRRLICEYYRYDRTVKIDQRKTLAAELGIALNTLRIKAYRIRHRLSNCIQDCAKKNDEG